LRAAAEHLLYGVSLYTITLAHQEAHYAGLHDHVTTYTAFHYIYKITDDHGKPHFSSMSKFLKRAGALLCLNEYLTLCRMG
jgi:hypothetical protein